MGHRDELGLGGERRGNPREGKRGCDCGGRAHEFSFRFDPLPIARLACMIIWDEWEYWSITDELVVSPPSPNRPSSWSGRKSIEATVETLLALNLTTLTGIPLRLLKRASPIEASADIIATDALHRIHIFELKKGSISGQSAAQLEQYLLRYVFADPDAFINAMADLGGPQVTEIQLARDIAGVWANERVGIVGYKKIVRELGEGHALLNPGGRRLSKYAYSNKLSDEDKLDLFYATLTVHAQKRNLVMPDFDEVKRVAKLWSELFADEPLPASGGLTARKRLVLWLVGSSISDDAIERVRLWRRSGVDARVLQVAGRSDGKRWTLGVRREHAPQRTEAEMRILERAASESGEQRIVKVEFYDRKAASQHSRHGGELLDEPIAELR